MLHVRRFSNKMEFIIRSLVEIINILLGEAVMGDKKISILFNVMIGLFTIVTGLMTYKLLLNNNIVTDFPKAYIEMIPGVFCLLIFCLLYRFLFIIFINNSVIRYFIYSISIFLFLVYLLLNNLVLQIVISAIFALFILLIRILLEDFLVTLMGLGITLVIIFQIVLPIIDYANFRFSMESKIYLVFLISIVIYQIFSIKISNIIYWCMDRTKSNQNKYKVKNQLLTISLVVFIVFNYLTFQNITQVNIEAINACFLTYAAIVTIDWKNVFNVECMDKLLKKNAKNKYL